MIDMYIKDLTESSVSMPLNTPNTKFEEIPPKDVEGDTFLVKTTPLRRISSKELAKICTEYTYGFDCKLFGIS